MPALSGDVLKLRGVSSSGDCGESFFGVRVIPFRAKEVSQSHCSWKELYLMFETFSSVEIQKPCTGPFYLRGSFGSGTNDWRVHDGYSSAREYCP